MSEQERLPTARIRSSWWPGWIWLLPLGVVGFLIWLALRTWVFGGATVTVAFASSAGITSGAPVKFRDVQVGTVRTVRFNDGMTQVLFELDMQAQMTDLLREDTRFWIARPSLAGGQLTNLVSGPHVAMDPGPGAAARRFEGLKGPPRVERWDPGRSYVLESADPGALAVGSPVLYMKTPIGEVRGVSLADAETVEVALFVRDEYTHLVRNGSRFWRGGDLSLRTEGGAPAVELPSLAALVSGSVILFTPRHFPGPPAEDGHVFALHGSRAAALATDGAARFPYLVRFPGPVGGLGPGVPLELDGVEIGRVAHARLEYDAGRGALATQARLVVDAGALGLNVAEVESRGDLQSALNRALAQLVEQGRRVRATGGLLPGSRAIALESVARADPAELGMRTSPPTLPAVRATGGLDQVLASLSDVAGTIETLPLQPIAHHIRRAAERIDGILHDPALESSIRSLDAALADVERVAGTVEGNTGPLLESLQRAAQSTQDVARRAEQLMGGPVRQNQDLMELVGELTDAARAVSELASYLSRHPEALVTGRD